MRSTLPALASLLLVPALAGAAGAGYSLDPVHTRVLFAVSHAGYSQALGTVSGSSGRLWFDPDDWSSARLAVSVPLARLDLGELHWNRAATAGNLLDLASYPVATFTSTRIEAKDPRHAAVCGTLTLHGVARETCMDVTFNQLRRYPLPPFRQTAGFSATTTLSRKDFGIDAWPTVIGDRVELRIEAEAVQDGHLAAGDVVLPTGSTPAMPAARDAAPSRDDKPPTPP